MAFQMNQHLRIIMFIIILYIIIVIINLLVHFVNVCFYFLMYVYSIHDNYSKSCSEINNQHMLPVANRIKFILWMAVFSNFLTVIKIIEKNGKN